MIKTQFPPQCQQVSRGKLPHSIHNRQSTNIQWRESNIIQHIGANTLKVMGPHDRIAENPNTAGTTIFRQPNAHCKIYQAIKQTVCNHEQHI